MSELPTSPCRAAVLTVSDRCSRAEARDTSGPALEAILRDQLGAEIVARACVPDEEDRIEAQLRDWCARRRNIDIILTTGGTGLAPRDVTPEAAARVIQRRHDAILELARLRCYEKTPRTFLSRAVAGVAQRTLIITLPGSTRGATENLNAILDILPHAIETLRGEVLDDGRPAPIEPRPSGSGPPLPPPPGARAGRVVEHND